MACNKVKCKCGEINYIPCVGWFDTPYGIKCQKCGVKLDKKDMVHE